MFLIECVGPACLDACVHVLTVLVSLNSRPCSKVCICVFVWQLLYLCFFYVCALACNCLCVCVCVCVSVCVCLSAFMRSHVTACGRACVRT